MLNKKIYFGIVGLMTSCTFAMSQDNHLLLASGTDETTFPNNRPLLYTKLNDGSIKRVEHIDNFPAKTRFAETKLSICKDKTCLVAGFYEDKVTSQDRPMLVVSSDAGKSWTYIQNYHGMPQDSSNIHFNSVQCTAESCYLFGSYARSETDPYHAQALVLMANISNPYVWTKQDLSHLPSEWSAQGLRGSYCVEDRCLVNGWYKLNGFPEKPFILSSHNGGRSWEFIDKFTNQPDPAIFNWPSLTAITCFKNACVSTGKYFTGVEKPFFLISKDSGLTWTSTENIKVKTPGSFDIDKVAMNDKQMVAIGMTTGKMDEGENLLLVSDDHGASWANESTQCVASFQDVKCTADRCIVVGYTSGYKTCNQHALIMLRKNASAWAKNEKIENTPKDYTASDAFALHCDDVSCMIAGHYNKEDSHRYPMLLKSTNDLTGWSFEHMPDVIGIKSSLRFITGNE